MMLKGGVLLQTSEHMATFNALTKTDAQAARVIDMRMRKLQRLQVWFQHILAWRRSTVHCAAAYCKHGPIFVYQGLFQLIVLLRWTDASLVLR